MATKRLRSRILQYFSKTLLEELYRVCTNPVISDNNLKVSAMLELLNKHNVDYVELGPGTNRLAVLIDNYVFKIALDKWGMRDNLNEFTVSQELQPYVVKTYETNELISVCEYVTLISREEFEEQKDVIRGILSILAESYLLGDVGTVSKNFCNWGYRDNGELVILDFAYIYRVQGDELLCSKDQSILEYDENFHNLRCPTCGKKYTFMDVRRKITMEQEKRENEIAKQLAYKLTKPVQEFNEGYKDEDEKSSSLYIKRENVNDNKKEESTMKRRDDYFISREEIEDSYNEALELMKKIMKGATDEDVSVAHSVAEDTTTNIVEIHKETPTEKSHIRIIKQVTGDTDGDYETDMLINNEEKMKEFINDATNELKEFSNLEEVVEEVNEVFEEIVLDTSNALEESKEVPVEFENDHVYAIKYMKMDEEETTEVDVTTVSVFDVDNDGDNEIVIDHEKVEVSSGQTNNNNVTEYLVNTDDYEPEDDEEMTEEDVEKYIVYEEDDESEKSEGEIVYTNEIKLNDNIRITNTVKVKADDDIEKLRSELSADDVDEEEIDDDRINGLAQQYIHLEEEVDKEYINRRKGDKNWK